MLAQILMSYWTTNGFPNLDIIDMGPDNYLARVCVCARVYVCARVCAHVRARVCVCARTQEGAVPFIVGY